MGSQILIHPDAKNTLKSHLLSAFGFCNRSDGPLLLDFRCAGLYRTDDTLGEFLVISDTGNKQAMQDTAPGKIFWEKIKGTQLGQMLQFDRFWFEIQQC